MNEIAVCGINLAKSERLVAQLDQAGLKSVALVESDLKAAAAAVASSPVSLLIIDPDGDMERLTALAGAARSAGKQVIGILPGPGNCTPAVIAALDDFVVEPFTTEELNARVTRLRPGAGEGAIRIDGLVIMPDSYEVTIDGGPLKLTFKEYELLKYFAENPGRVLTRQALLNQIWEYDYYGGTRTVDVHVRRLRAKLGTRYEGHIKTVRQVGYKFEK